jgi:hypothetical protein
MLTAWDTKKDSILALLDCDGSAELAGWRKSEESYAPFAAKSFGSASGESVAPISNPVLRKGFVDLIEIAILR